MYILTWLQWGHDLSAVETGQPRCSMGRRYRPGFNGATTFQPWKRRKVKLEESRGLLLQWGHDLSAVETRLKKRVLTPRDWLQWGHDLSAVETSMPSNRTASLVVGLQWGHDLSAVETGRTLSWPANRRPRFNGATTFQPWKRDGGQRMTPAPRASMGPRPFSRGNCFQRKGTGSSRVGLQWGHDLSAVET